jgi:hypothetical protein
MNAYNSVVRRIVSKGVYSAAISPPTDFTVAAGGFNPTILPIDLESINIDSNIRINSIGMFCNFADGLVWKSPGERIIPEIIARSYVKAVPNLYAGDSLVLQQNSKTVTVATGDVADYPAASTFVVEYDTVPTSGLKHKQLFTVSAITGPTTFTVSDYPLHSVTVVVGKVEEVTFVNLVKKRAIEINTLYEMVPLDLFFSPSEYATVNTDYIAVGAVFHNGQGSTFLTKSVDTAFATDICIFDFAAELEFTPA